MDSRDENSPPAREEPGAGVERRALLHTGAVAGLCVIGLAGCLEDDTPDTTEGAESASGTGTTATPSDEETPAEPSDRDEEETEAEDENGDDEEEEDEDQEEDEDGWYVRPETNPEEVPSSLVCDEDHEGRFPQRFEEAELAWGDDDEGHWELRVDTLSAEYGGTVTVRLRNRSDDDRDRTSRGDFNLQVETEAGWQDVRVQEQAHDTATTDELSSEQPDEGVEWEITMTEQGVPEADEGRGTVCPGLPSGRYRFVYDGTMTQPLGVAFDLRD